MTFSWKLFTWFFLEELEDPRSMLELVAGVQVGVVCSSRLPHFPNDLEPTLPETTKRTGMRLSLLTLSGVIGRSPRAFVARQI